MLERSCIMHNRSSIVKGLDEFAAYGSATNKSAESPDFHESRVLFPPMPATTGPYLSMAFFCERVLQEVDGVLSFIRAFDRWTVSGQADTMPPTEIPLTLVLTFRSGIYRGAAQVTVTPTSPSGAVLTLLQFPLQFEGDDERGAGILSQIRFPAQEAGLYWFEIAVNGQAYTNVPLRVIYQRAPGVLQAPPR